MVSRLWLVLLRSLWAHWAPLRPMRAFSALGFSWPSELVAAFAAGRGLYAPGATISFSRCKKAETARLGKTRQGQARPDKPSPGPGPGQASPGPAQASPGPGQARPGVPVTYLSVSLSSPCIPLPGGSTFPKGIPFRYMLCSFRSGRFPPLCSSVKNWCKIEKNRVTYLSDALKEHVTYLSVFPFAPRFSLRGEYQGTHVPRRVPFPVPFGTPFRYMLCVFLFPFPSGPRLGTCCVPCVSGLGGQGCCGPGGLAQRASLY